MKWVDQARHVSRQRTLLGIPLSRDEWLIIVGTAVMVIVVLASIPFMLHAALSVWGRLS